MKRKTIKIRSRVFKTDLLRKKAQIQKFIDQGKPVKVEYFLNDKKDTQIEEILKGFKLKSVNKSERRQYAYL